MSVSSQRTMVVVPSAPASSVMTPPPVNRPSCRIAKRVGGSNSVISTGSVTPMPKMRTVASPRVPTPTGPGVVSVTRFISCIHSGWSGMSATTAQVSSIGASTTTSIAHRGGRVRATACGEDAVPGERLGGEDQREREEPADHGRRSPHPRAVEADAGGGHLVERGLAVAVGQVHGRDRVRRAASSRSRGATASRAVALTQ